MSAVSVLQTTQRGARLRLLSIRLLCALPWFVVACALGRMLQHDRGAVAWLPAIIVAVVTAAWIQHGWMRMDRHWLSTRLDASRPDLEDSADLLLGLQPAVTPLQQLQRERLQQRIATRPPDLRQAWPARTLGIHLAAAALAMAALCFWPAASAPDTRTAPVVMKDGKIVPPRLSHAQLEVRAPAYTGIAVQRGSALSAKVPAGSVLRWTLRFQPQAQASALVFHDGTRLPLQRQADGSWTGTRAMQRSALYRIEPAQALDADGQPRLYRIDALPDRAPRVRVVEPDRLLSTLQPGQRRWAFTYEATDDHGVAATARLRVIRTQGSGENITAKETSLQLHARGEPRRRRFAHAFDLAALGLVPGDDLIVQLIVNDNRAPQPQTTRGPSLILRVPPVLAEQTGGLDGMVKKVMPAYFRSQRQIIIDAEALVKQKLRMETEAFAIRSDTLGVDQRLLRLRYGQFLGEESEDAAKPPPTSDAPQPDAADDAQKSSDAADKEAHHDDDGHDHGDSKTGQREATFGEESQVLERFGHTHDIPEAATLLDPKTRELLRAALNEMWQSEVHLRQADPQGALPYAYRALEFIKKVQQSERIYLAKTGPNLPPVDEARRMKGERAGIASRSDPLRAAPAADDTIAQAWRSLGPDAVQPPDLDALSRWLSTHDASAGDPLALGAAIEALRRDAGCVRCRARLRDLLWPLIAQPAGLPGERRNGGRMGDAYLDALRGGDSR